MIVTGSLSHSYEGPPKNLPHSPCWKFFMLFTRFHYSIAVFHLLCLKRGLNVLDALVLFYHGSGNALPVG